MLSGAILSTVILALVAKNGSEEQTSVWVVLIDFLAQPSLSSPVIEGLDAARVNDFETGTHGI